MPAKNVTMRHPKATEPVTVTARQARVLAKTGWKPADDTGEPAEQTGDEHTDENGSDDTVTDEPGKTKTTTAEVIEPGKPNTKTNPAR